MLTTSSNTRLPLGKPAASPPSRPKRLGLDVVGGIARLSTGWPGRETCAQGPVCDDSSSSSLIIRTLRRLAALHPPITAELPSALLGTEPLAVSCEIGICSAIVWMLSVFVASTPDAAG